VPSAVMRWFRYDEASARLTVMFQSGRCYVYQDVPAEVASAMRASFSKGQFFNDNIRDHFSFIRVEDETAD
jgi:hypothetical protein